MMFTRSDRSRLAQWWFTVDHALLGAILLLLGTGLVLSLAASPSVAIRKGLPATYFVERHAVFALIGALMLIAVSILSPGRIRRLAAGVLVAGMAAMVAVLVVGDEINGARRWLRIAGHSLQPSELMKPAFVVIAAWLLAEARRRRDVPALPLALGLLASTAALLLAQPDVGQTLLVFLVWSALYVLSGAPLVGAAALAGVGCVGVGGAYLAFDHVRSRVDRFLAGSPADNSQVDRAIQSFQQGGLVGRGPGEGTIKTQLPDAHTDFILAVVAEEHGAIAVLALVALFAFIVLRAMVRGLGDPEPAQRLAVTGLALLLGTQALINMAVNVGLMPAKGMTLPFVSAGGSSILATALGLGMMLGLARRRPGLGRHKAVPIVATVGGGMITGAGPTA